MSITETAVPSTAANKPMPILKMWRECSMRVSGSLLFRRRVRSKRGGKMSASAAPLEAPARETKSPTSGTNVATSEDTNTSPIRTKTLGNRGGSG
jgi:hypothetical protein